MPSHAALIFGFFSVPCIVFSMLFTYKRLMSDGGSAWKIAHWSAILLYLSGISLIAIDGKPVSLSDGGLLIAWNVGCFALAYLATKLAENAFNGLNQTIGARRVLIPMMRSFALVPILATGLVFTGLLHGANFHSSFLLVSSVMFVTSYLAAKRLKAARSSTASSIATIIWAPSVLANAALLPALAGTQLWLAFSNTALVTWVDYAGGMAALAVSIIAPIAGGVVASKQLQLQAARSLSGGTERIPLEQHGTCHRTNLEQCFDE